MEESIHFAYNVALEPQAAKLQTFMSATNATQQRGVVRGFLLVFSYIIDLFQMLFYTNTEECQILMWVCLLVFFKLALWMDATLHYNDVL